ncbi:MAG TPA: multicopper oxidase family protein [Methylovirgula sp.]|jgi:FtsP/CotA-like multicopper oxidase with cupredoxin domain
MRLTRRHFLGTASAALLPFRAAASPQEDEGFRVLTAQKTEIALLHAPAAKTAALGFGGTVPGPLLRYKKDAEIKVRLLNALDEPVTFCAEDMRIANAMTGIGGLTQTPVAPGQSYDYRFTAPDAGFYWYRSFVAPRSTAQLERGLYGPLIIDEAEPPECDGDLVFILDDWQLDRAGQIAISPPATDPNGPYILTVSGQPSPLVKEVGTGARLRIRLLSLVQSQLMFVTFTGLEVQVIAIDGQPCETFAPLRQTIPIGPGASFDLLCDLPHEADKPALIAWRTGERNDRPIVFFKTAGAARPKLPPVSSLRANPLLPTGIKLQASHKIDLIVEATPDKSAPKDKPVSLSPGKHGPLLLAGKPAQTFAPTPLFSVKANTPVTLGLVNKTNVLVQMYVQGHAVRLLHDLDDGWDPYWRSRVIVPENHTKRVAFLADQPGKWAIECQSVEPTPEYLVAWFEVT